MGEYYEEQKNGYEYASTNKEEGTSDIDDDYHDDNVRSSLPSLTLSSSFTKTVTSHVIPKSMALVLLLAVVVPLMDLCFTFGRTARYHHNTSNRSKKHDDQEVLLNAKNDLFISKTLRLLQDKDSDNDEASIVSGSSTPHAGKLPPGVGLQILIDLENIQSMIFLQDKNLISRSMMEILQRMFQIPEDDEENEASDEDDAEKEGANIDDDVKLELKHFCHHKNNQNDIAHAGIYCVGQWSVVATNRDEKTQTEQGTGQYALTTSPLKNTMTIDLYVSNNDGGYMNDSSIEIARLAQGLVAQRASNNDDNDSIDMNYIHNFRGFHSSWDTNPDMAPPLSRAKDLGKDLNNGKPRWALKEVVASVETNFQQIDIVDFINTHVQSYEGYLKAFKEDDDDSTNDISYEKHHLDFFKPNRVVYLDGVSQSTRRGDEPYHEALVQPGMFAHSNPKRAAIIGGGEGATLREILKHDTIEHVKMIEIDAIMVEKSREFLPEWNSCDDIEGSTPNCFDEPRADVRMEDALAWFIDRFGPNASIKGEEKFDVIIMDALDPQDNVAFASALYSNDDFTESLYNALTPEGVLVMQLGEVPFQFDIPDEYSISMMRASLEHDLIKFGFQSLHKYEEPWCGFEVPWSYIVAFKSIKTRRNWYDNEATINMKIQKRIRSSKTKGTSLLKNFDGSTMKRYQVPSRAFESILCHSPSFLQEDEHHASLCIDIHNQNDYNIQISKDFTLFSQESITAYQPVTKFVETYGVKNTFLNDKAYIVSASNIQQEITSGNGVNGTVILKNSKEDECRSDGMECKNTNTAHTTFASHDFNVVVARRLPHLVYTS